MEAQHQPIEQVPAVQCSGITTKGVRCRRSKRTTGPYYCGHHIKQEVEKPNDDDGYSSDTTMRSYTSASAYQEPLVYHADLTSKSMSNLINKFGIDVKINDDSNNIAVKTRNSAKKDYIMFLIDHVEASLAKLKLALEEM